MEQIIMDIEMPNVDGVATVSSIRKMGFDDLPVIFLTAKTDKTTVLSFRYGAVFFYGLRFT